MGVLVIGVLLDLQRLVYAVSQQHMPATLSDLPGPTLHIVVRVATVVLFFAWFDRVWRNSAALAQTPGQARSATLLALLVPPFCFFRPVQILHEVWIGARRPDGDGRWFPRLLLLWWIAFLVPPALLLTGISREGISPAERWLRLVAGESLNVLAGLLAVAVVYFVSARQGDVQSAWSGLRRQVPASAEAREAVETAIVADHAAGDPVVAIAPAQPVAGDPRLRRKSVELLIREQAKRRPPLQRAVGFVRGLVRPRQPRRR